MILLLTGRSPEVVRVELPAGQNLDISIHSCALKNGHTACCTVIKDAGDDPDVTHRAEIGAKVSLINNSCDTGETGRVKITGGEGVGKVTRPGLDIPVGQPAINPIPRKMIAKSVKEVLDLHHCSAHVLVEVFVPRGEVIAQKTLNARLGIVGGISILGTTGLVKPMSHEAYVATINAALAVARAAGLTSAVFSTGRRTERLAQMLWPDIAEMSFVQIGDFFKSSLEAASINGFSEITLAVFFGKAVKMAQHAACTHAGSARLCISTLAGWVQEATGNRSLAKRVSTANTARHAFDMIMPAYPEVIHSIGQRMVRAAREFGGNRMAIRGVIFDYDGRVAFDSGKRGDSKK
jgi:cobalt-precorrin-5B (C1)-methyltransferase